MLRHCHGAAPLRQAHTGARQFPALFDPACMFGGDDGCRGCRDGGRPAHVRLESPNPLQLLRVQLFNETYLEREEDSVIRLRTLEDEAEEAQTVAALKAVYRCGAHEWSGSSAPCDGMTSPARATRHLSTSRRGWVHPKAKHCVRVQPLGTPASLTGHPYLTLWASPCFSLCSRASPWLRGRHFVDFHGEMLLLVHWSILAYTGLVKILKKHHKRTGLRVRAPHLDNLLNQPFCSVEVTCVGARHVGLQLRGPAVPRAICHSQSYTQGSSIEPVIPCFSGQSLGRKSGPAARQACSCAWHRAAVVAWPKRRVTSNGWCSRIALVICAQLMSELVRKAEADIDSLRRRLAGLGAAGELRSLALLARTAGWPWLSYSQS